MADGEEGLTWAAFAYDEHLDDVNNIKSIEVIAKDWMEKCEELPRPISWNFITFVVFRKSGRSVNR